MAVVEVTITYTNGTLKFSPDPVTIKGDGNSMVFWNNKDSRAEETGTKGLQWICAKGGDPKDPTYKGWKTPVDGPQVPQYTDPASGLTRPGNTPMVTFGGKKGVANEVQYWSSLDRKTIGTIKFT